MATPPSEAVVTGGPDIEREPEPAQVPLEAIIGYLDRIAVALERIADVVETESLDLEFAKHFQPPRVMLKKGARHT